MAPLMPTGNSGRYANEEWHDTREEAATETFSIEEWSDIEQTQYDLEEVDFDRKKKPSSYYTKNYGPESPGGAKGGEEKDNWDLSDLFG